MKAWLVWAWWRLIAFLFARYELIPVDRKDYLSRWHYPQWIANVHGMRCAFLFLHYFHTGDPDRGWHNHPWFWMDSRILRGAYLQAIPYLWRGEWREARRVFRTGDRNLITNEYHKIDLLRRPTWSLVRCGPKHGRSWGFMDHRGRTWPANPSGEVH